MKLSGVYNDTTEADCSHSEESTEVWIDPDTQCGIGRFRPDFLQVGFQLVIAFHYQQNTTTKYKKKRREYVYSYRNKIYRHEPNIWGKKAVLIKDTSFNKHDFGRGTGTHFSLDTKITIFL